MLSDNISSIGALRAIYPRPAADSMAMRCIFPELDQHHQSFIALSPFLVIASVDENGNPDVSPRGDLPGFVRVKDTQTLVVPDRPGNKKIMTLTNVLKNPAISLIFFVPGRTESLRVKGTGHITTDPDILGALAVQEKSPASALAVTIQLAWFHCGRALIRSRLWDQQLHSSTESLPSLANMLADQIAGLDPAESRARLEKANSALLWSDAPT